MWKNYLMTALRGLARDRVSAAVQIFGLGLALCAVLLIAAWVSHEYSYERWIPHHERVYAVRTTISFGPDRSNYVLAAPDFVRDLLSGPESGVELAGRLGRVQTKLFRDSEDSGLKLHRADAALLEILALDVLAGSAGSALVRPDALVLTLSAAERLAGSAPAAMGMRLEGDDGVSREVTAVIADLPRATRIEFEALIPYPEASTSVAQGGVQQMFMVSDSLYLRLAPETTRTVLLEDLKLRIEQHFRQRLGGASMSMADLPVSFDLVAIADTHFGDDTALGASRGGSLGMVFAVAGTGLAILIMALVNHAGLAFSEMLSRIREIALRRTLGAGRGQIASQFIGEALVKSLIALAFGFIAAHQVVPVFAALMDRPILAGDLYRPAFLGVAILLALVTGIAGGAYPAMVAARQRPGGLMIASGGHPIGGVLRPGLLVMQYALTIGLISGLLVHAAQMRFADRQIARFGTGTVQLLQQRPGFDYARMKTFGERLSGRPGIDAVAFGTTAPGLQNVMNRSYRSPNMDDPVQLESYSVSPGYFDLLGIEPVAGSSFGAIAANDSGKTASPRWAIINQQALSQLGFSGPNDAIGSMVSVPAAPVSGGNGARNENMFEIVAVLPDLQFRSIHDPVRPTIYTSGRDEFAEEALRSQQGRPSFTVMLVSLDPADIENGLHSIEAVRDEVAPGVALNALFIDQMLLSFYENDRKRQDLLSWATGLALVLAVMGLYARAGQSASARTREVALRKTLGAGVSDIMRLMLWQFTRPVLIANLIAWPIAGWFANDWLERFAIRIDLTPVPFLLAGGAALAIALLTVSGHAFRVARTHPALALREG